MEGVTKIQSHREIDEGDFLLTVVEEGKKEVNYKIDKVWGVGRAKLALKRKLNLGITHDKKNTIYRLTEYDSPLKQRLVKEVLIR